MRVGNLFRAHVWNRLTGKYAKIRNQNEREAMLAFYCDREEKDALIFRQLEERQSLNRKLLEEKKTHALEVQRHHSEIAETTSRGKPSPERLREKSNAASKKRRTSGRDIEPEI